MAGISRHNSASAVQGFSVFQASLGAPLQFLPALGTKQLDDLINAYLPGPISIKEKRASISMDFCEYARLTGETFKYYAVLCPSFGSATADSPASSAMHDSGYGSSFNASPVPADMNLWVGPSGSGPFVSPPQSLASAPSSQPKARASGARPRTTDFSHLPGMKIMTRDGQDVTTSASRGCKTKEQRDHAHLMRILKACEACRKKKIRCDPSHRKQRAAAQAQSEAESKPAKRSRKPVAGAPARPSPPGGAGMAVEEAPVQLDLAATTGGLAEETLAAFDESWEQFVHYDLFDQPANVFPPDYNPFLADAGNLFSSPSSGSSAVSPSQPFTPASALPLSVGYGDGSLLAGVDSQEPTLPYLASGAHGSNYVDFNLYSPASSFLDEEPQALQKTAPHRGAPDSTSQVLPPGAGGQDGGVHGRPSASPDDHSVSGVTANNSSSLAGSTTKLSRVTCDLGDPKWGVPGPRDLPDGVLPDGDLARAPAVTGTEPQGSGDASAVPGRAAALAGVPRQRRGELRALGDILIGPLADAGAHRSESSVDDSRQPAAGGGLVLPASPSSSPSSRSSRGVGRSTVSMQSSATDLSSPHWVGAGLGGPEGLAPMVSTRQDRARRGALAAVSSDPSAHRLSPQQVPSTQRLEEVQPWPKGYRDRQPSSAAARAAGLAPLLSSVSSLDVSSPETRAGPTTMPRLRKQSTGGTGASQEGPLETAALGKPSARAPAPDNGVVAPTTSHAAAAAAARPPSASVFSAAGEEASPSSPSPMPRLVLGLVSVAAACALRVPALAGALDPFGLFLAVLCFAAMALRCGNHGPPETASPRNGTEPATRSGLPSRDEYASRLTSPHPVACGLRRAFCRRLAALPAPRLL